MWPVVALDGLALLLAYFMPALAHLSSIPLYVIEPFRLVVLASLVLMNNKRNAFLLAGTLPFFSYAVATHPLLAKSFLMSVELIINVFVYTFLNKKIGRPFISLLLSIGISKFFYYLMKYCFISFGILSMSLVSTSILIQTIVAIITSLLFSSIQRRLVIHE